MPYGIFRPFQLDEPISILKDVDVSNALYAYKNCSFVQLLFYRNLLVDKVILTVSHVIAKAPTCQH